MKISLLHPSRGRPLRAIQTANFWMKRAVFPENIEHLLSVDKSDTSLNNYRHLSSGHLLVNNNSSVVEATNQAAKLCTGDILIYLSDDFECPKNWDQLIIDKVKGLKGEWLLKVNDCLQGFDVPVLTIPIMSRALYERLGYFWHTEYKSMFCDEHLYGVCNKNKWIIKAPDLKFPHNHPANGKAKTDQTYKDSNANWGQGKELFKKHKAQNFPL
jgi:hypothetical protein